MSRLVIDNLPADVDEALRKHASVIGRDPGDVAVELIRDGLTRKQWIQGLLEIVTSHELDESTLKAIEEAGEMPPDDSVDDVVKALG